MYDSAREGFSGDWNWLTDEFRWVLVDLADYTFAATHDTLADVPDVAVVALSPALAGKTNTDGYLDATDPSFGNVTGDQAEALILIRGTGIETSNLVAFFDTGVTGLPVTPNTGPIDITHNASGILRI
jgi:hypothetical protein